MISGMADNGKYSRFVEYTWITRIGVWLIYITMLLIPGVHVLMHQVPPDHELQKVEGNLFFKEGLWEGSLIGLNTADGEAFFTCKDSIRDSNYCLLSDGIKHTIEGKQATVFWYRQPAFLWLKRDRLVELHVGKETVVSRAQEERRINIDKEIAWWMAPIEFALFIGIDIFCTKKFGRRKKHHG